MRKFGNDLCKVVFLVDDIQQKMRGDITKRTDADHAPHVDQIAVPNNAPERRDGQRQAEKYQRPEPRAMDEIIERARAVRDRVVVEQRFGQRKQQQRQCGDP